MATSKPTKRRATPRPGTRQSIRVDQQLADDLAVLMTTGCDLSAAVRTAVGIVATMYRTAWHHRITPVGTAPTLAAFKFVEKPPVVGPPSLPWVTSDGPMWQTRPLTSTDDTRRQQQPTRPRPVDRLAAAG
ncbi:hypothetical protein ACFOOM_10020 [Streptomyces echinoruber]|uniref:hypothetical protein n=1 Tax=Streptomyces echinoruber TaxID=68898 RepID=UPI0036144A3A